MTTPATIPPAEPPGRRTGWLALTTTHRGAAHVATKLPNQDAVVAEPAGPSGVIAAVADGHGHWRHARSARGSQLAVAVGCQAGQELASLLNDDEVPLAGHDARSMASQIGDLVRETLVPAIVQRWRDAVLADVAADPFTSEELQSRQDGDDETVAYGSTLLLAVAIRQWLVLAQIGDGDIVGVLADGGALQPVPDDPQLDGRYTTSLCGTNARADFRVAVVDVRQAPLAAIMLATDGYGNAQIADQWTDAFSKDLAEMIRERDEHWLASQLPMWAAKCASSDGSADDTTVALLLGSPGLGRAVAPAGGLGGPGTDRGSEDTTVPVAIHSATMPSSQVPAGSGPVEPVTIRLPAIDADEHEPARGPGSNEPAMANPDRTAPDNAAPDNAEPDAADPADPEPVSTEPETTVLDARKIAQWPGDR